MREPTLCSNATRTNHAGVLNPDAQVDEWQRTLRDRHRDSSGALRGPEWRALTKAAYDEFRVTRQITTGMGGQAESDGKVPAHFLAQELGYAVGSTVSLCKTLATVDAVNRRNARDAEAQEKTRRAATKPPSKRAKRGKTARAWNRVMRAAEKLRPSRETCAGAGQ